MNFIKYNLYTLRINSNLDQKQFGGLLNLSREAISHYEAGRNTPKIHTLIKLTEIYDLTLDKLCLTEL